MRRPVLSCGANETRTSVSSRLLISSDKRLRQSFSLGSSFTLFQRGEYINSYVLWRWARSPNNALLNMLLCSRSNESAHRYIPTFHTTLFSSLTFNDASLSAAEASLFSGSAVSGFLCIQQLDRYVGAVEAPCRAVDSSLLQQLRLVRLMTTTAMSDNSLKVLGDRLSAALRGSQPLPKSVLSGLLRLPCHPTLLRVLVQHVLRLDQGKIEADAFEAVMHALLANDNFFRLETFVRMHEIVELLLHAVEAAPAPFDFVTIKWTPLMTKWARVYTKMFKGDLLYHLFQRLLRAVPEAEVKIPSSFYVYLLGAILDANIYATEKPSAGWDELLHVAQQALRLHGRSTRGLHALWIVVLKAALTMDPPRRACERLLQGYHACTAAERPAPISHDAFSQLTRHMCTAIGPSTLQRHDQRDANSSLEEARALVLSYSKLVLDREDVSFLWVVNAIAAISGALWERFGAAAHSLFAALLETLEKALAARDVAGFHVENNPPLARLMERFGIGQRAAFWWTCGCGYASPSSCSHCLECTQRRKAMWTCSACGSLHSAPCSGQRCHCGQMNPRLTAAIDRSRALCSSCGGVCDEGGACRACTARHGPQPAGLACTFCHAPLKAHMLHCPSCFMPAKGKKLSIWYCAACSGASLSSYSSCQRCGEKRKVGCFTAPFTPWQCGCGAACHPCQWSCRPCSSAGPRSPERVYTCAACGCVSSLKTTIVLQAGGWEIPVRLCDHCGETHPHDRATLQSPKLPRRCALCGTSVPLSHNFLNGGFYHCGVNQWVNENTPFQCTKCEHRDKKQFGYECRFCFSPRRELCEHASTFVWRCVCEAGADGTPCGHWNYSWSDHCTCCGHVRAQSEWECRARSFLWQCPLCHRENLPTDVYFCRHCKNGIQVPLPCQACGRSHLAHSCDV
ncbi:hypothetical protein STCU_07644 [Strigomonas culicis]|uniref:RanBP2-type domain-containing protein n=1 Tax=Strigomonas culicis TaxID=28005 RepID=S9VK14_9TRYP|nr:hypothetical protein STCU_07644 [Strigomonas culicis]|eukprot:EPY23580.1 hypothetical protein STCU_07644 [Strigomonas culicis]